MLVAETVLGNVDDETWAARYADRPDDEIERVVLDDRDRRRSRVRTTTDAGTDIGIVVDADRRLQPGDVLVDDEDRLVVVAFEARPALVVSFEGENMSTAAAIQLASLGYQVGNRHWDMAVRDGAVLVALGTDEDQKIAEVTAALPDGAETHREAVDPTLFDDAGLGSRADHTHDSDTDHTHSHDGHTHESHDHTHEYSHEGISGHRYDAEYDHTWFRTVSTDEEDGDD